MLPAPWLYVPALASELWLQPTLLTLYVEGHFMKMRPVSDYLQHVSYTRSVLWIGGEHMPNQVIDLIAVLVLPIGWNFEDPTGDSKLIGLYEWVDEVAQRIEHTTQHPHIHLLADTILQKRIHYFRWPVHWRCISFQLVFVVGVLRLRH